MIYRWQKWLARCPKPWSVDKALQIGRFCNVFRFLDRESLFVMNEIIIPLRGSGSNRDHFAALQAVAAAPAAAQDPDEKQEPMVDPVVGADPEKLLFNIILFRAYVNSGESMQLLGA